MFAQTLQSKRHGQEEVSSEDSADGKAQSFLAGSGIRELRRGKEYTHFGYSGKGIQSGWSWTEAFGQTCSECSSL